LLGDQNLLLKPTSQLLVYIKSVIILVNKIAAGAAKGASQARLAMEADAPPAAPIA